MRTTGLAFFFGCVLIAGCKGGKTADSSTDRTEGTTASGNQPKPESGGPKVKITDVVVGKGKGVAAAGDTVWVQYRGTLTNGTEFDSNMSENKDVMTFTIGQGSVIKGWDEAIPGMRVGGERKLYVPAALAYGPNANKGIPANSDLLFDVKMLGLVKAGEDNVIDTTEVKVGNGRVAKEGDKVTIQYVGRLLNNKVFEDSRKKGPYSFTIGKGETLPCIEEGVRGMKVGGTRTVVAPPLTAYVSQPYRLVPANSEVVFTIDLLSIK